MTRASSPLPGERLRAIVARVCDAPTMTHLIDPIVADLQHEHAAVRRHRGVWHGRRVLLVGYIALLKALTLHGGRRAMGQLHTWITPPSSAGRRALVYATIAIILSTLLLELPPMLTLGNRLSPSDPWLLIYLIPQTLPLTIPVGFVVGIVTALGRRPDERTSADAMSRLATGTGTGTVLAMAVACAIVSFIALDRMVPAGNQAFREAIGGRPTPKGPNEMTVRELGEQYRRLAAGGLPTTTRWVEGLDIRLVAFRYHVCWAIPCAPIVLGLAALATRRHRGLVRALIAAVACGAYFGYYMIASRPLLYWPTLASALPPSLLAWLPNVIVGAAALAWIAAGRGRDRTQGPSRESGTGVTLGTNVTAARTAP